MFAEDPIYFSTADCVGGWNLTTDGMRTIIGSKTTELVDTDTYPEVTIQF